jgi:hypothetical protein
VPAILKRVETGGEIIIERNAQPACVIRRAEPLRRKASECIARMPANSTTGTIEANSVREVEAVISAHEEALEPPPFGLMRPSATTVGTVAPSDSTHRKQLEER